MSHYEFPYIGLDTESNGEDIRDGRGYGKGISIAIRTPIAVYTTYFPYRHPVEPDGSSHDIAHNERAKLKEFLESYKGWLYIHNAKFDLESLRTLGITYTGKFLCTLKASQLVNENLPYSRELNGCIKMYCPGVEHKKETDYFKRALAHFGWGGLPYSVIHEYAAHDAALHLMLGEVLAEKFDEEDLWNYWIEHKMNFFHVIIAMERRGVAVDQLMCNQMTEIGEIQMEDLKEILGMNPGSSKDLGKLLIDDLGLPVVKTTPKGAPSFDKEAMEVYDRALERMQSEVAQQVLAYRGWQKSVSSNYKPYVDLLSPDGRLRCNYKLHGTKTGRMSCEKPNLQQIPRVGDKPWNGTMKSAFIPMPGYQLWEADYSQLEFRLQVAYAQEKWLLEIFADPDRDVFSELAEELDMPRQDVKTLVYTMSYGGGITRISTVFGVSPAEASGLREMFWQRSPNLKAINELAQYKCVKQRKIKMWSGRYRHFRFPHDEKHKAFNSVIQGGAADIVEYAMVKLYQEVDNAEECRMLLQVHDSVVFEIKEGCGTNISTYQTVYGEPAPRFWS